MSCHNWKLTGSDPKVPPPLPHCMNTSSANCSQGLRTDSSSNVMSFQRAAVYRATTTNMVGASVKWQLRLTNGWDGPPHLQFLSVGNQKTDLAWYLLSVDACYGIFHGVPIFSGGSYVQWLNSYTSPKTIHLRKKWKCSLMNNHMAYTVDMDNKTQWLLLFRRYSGWCWGTSSSVEEPAL